MPRAAVPTDDDSCEALLREIEAALLLAIPKRLRAMKLTEPSYGLFVCYADLTTDSYGPWLKPCPESFLRRAVADRDVWKVWAIAEVPGTIVPIDGLTAKCHAAYEYLTRRWGEPDHDDELVEILPFRRMVYRVCLALNSYDWSGVLPVTDEFTVMACDWHSGDDIRADADGSVPAARQRTLKKRGLYFNPEALPKPKSPAGNPIARVAKLPAAEQLPYWREQFRALAFDEPCDAARANWGPKRVVAALVKLGEAGGAELVALAEELAAAKRFTLFRELRDGLEAAAPRDAGTERRLWAVFEACVKAQRGRKTWDAAPADIAFALQHLHGMAKYGYWVVRNEDNVIESLKEIREQARRHGML